MHWILIEFDWILLGYYLNLVAYIEYYLLIDCLLIAFSTEGSGLANADAVAVANADGDAEKAYIDRAG